MCVKKKKCVYIFAITQWLFLMLSLDLLFLILGISWFAKLVKNVDNCLWEMKENVWVSEKNKSQICTSLCIIRCFMSNTHCSLLSLLRSSNETTHKFMSPISIWCLIGQHFKPNSTKHVVSGIYFLPIDLLVAETVS